MNWIKIAESGEVAHLLKNGDARAILINDKRLCIAKHADTYFVTQLNCPHAGAALSDGWCDEQGHLVCPVHRIKFDMATGKNSTGEGYYIKTYPVENRADGLYVGFENKKWWNIF